MKKLFFIDRKFALEPVIEKLTPYSILLLQAKYLNFVAELKCSFDASMTVDPPQVQELQQEELKINNSKLAKLLADPKSEYKLENSHK